jgi:hypothetical protein
VIGRAQHAPLAGIGTMAVLQAGGAGDFVLMLPALPALLAAYPQARVTLVGKAWHAAFLHGRGVVDEVVVLPPIPGVGAPPDVPQVPDDAAATTRLCEALRAPLRSRLPAARRRPLFEPLPGAPGWTPSDPPSRRPDARRERARATI